MSYGCHNRTPFRDVYPVQDGWNDLPRVTVHSSGYGDSRLPRIVEQPFALSRPCQYTLSDLGRVDPGCVGCKHRISTEENHAKR